MVRKKKTMPVFSKVWTTLIRHRDNVRVNNFCPARWMVPPKAMFYVWSCSPDREPQFCHVLLLMEGPYQRQM
jgi:hypothetical protein